MIGQMVALSRQSVHRTIGTTNVSSDSLVLMFVLLVGLRGILDSEIAEPPTLRY